MKNKRIRIGGALLLAASLSLAGLKLPSAYAALPVDLTKKGQIEFRLSQNVYPTPSEEGEQPVNYDDELTALPMQVKLYKVADITATGAYTVTTVFQSLDSEVKAISSTTSAEDWTAMAEEAAKAAAGQTGTYKAEKAANADSVTLSSQMDLGLYLVLVENVVTDSYIYSFNPYLISVPNNYYSSTEDDSWVYSLTGDHAVGLKPERTGRLGDLVIEKNLTSYNASLGGANFIYDVTVEALDGTISSNVYQLSFTGAGSDSLTVTDLPAGATVTVTERYTGSSYSLTTEASQTAVITANPNSDAKVLDPENEGKAEEAAYTPVGVSFTNSYDERQNGGSSVVNTFYKNGETVDWKNDIEKAEVN